MKVSLHSIMIRIYFCTNVVTRFLNYDDVVCIKMVIQVVEDQNYRKNAAVKSDDDADTLLHY